MFRPTVQLQSNNGIEWVRHGSSNAMHMWHWCPSLYAGWVSNPPYKLQ